MSDHLHYIEHRHEAGYGIKTTFTCKGDPTSPCHQYPPAELAMERWSDADKHLFVSHEECTWEQWATHADCDTLCAPLTVSRGNSLMGLSPMGCSWTTVAAIGHA